MGKQKLAQSDGRSADALVKQGGKAEKRLLRLERRAERSLTEAQARLRKAQMRLERRLSAVSDAEAKLRTRQAARATGPHESNGTSSETPPPSVAIATEDIVQASEPAQAAVESPVVVPASKTPANKASASKASASQTAAVKTKAPSTPPPAAKAPARRTTSRPAAPKEQAS